jgi:hypothetical protein
MRRLSGSNEASLPLLPQVARVRLQLRRHWQPPLHLRQARSRASQRRPATAAGVLAERA